MGNDRSLVLLVAMLVIGAFAIAPSATAPGGAQKKVAGKAASTASGESSADVVTLLRELWDLDESWVLGPAKPEQRDLQERFKTTRSSVIIATVADPNDSHMAITFDESVEAFVLAASAAGYTLDRYRLPWSTSGQPEALSARIAVDGREVKLSSASAAAGYRERPGALLFRDGREPEHALLDAADDCERPRRGLRDDIKPDRALLVLLVGETATSGVHGAALQVALDTAAALGGPAKPIAIVGPSFSGSAPTMRNAIERWRRGGATPGEWPTAASGQEKENECEKSTATNRQRISLFSAGATAENLPQRLNSADCDGQCATRFRALSWSSRATQCAMEQFLADHGASADNTVLFYEAGTAYGATGRGSANCPGRQQNPPATTRRSPLRVPYPLHLAQARSAWAEAGLLADEKTLNSRARSSLTLAFDDGQQRRDVPPVFAAADSANTADLQLSTVLADLRRRNVAFVGILGSDTRDKLFLARQIKRELPDVQLYTLLADVTYLHPRWLRDLDGMWVASSYPLTTATQSRDIVLPFAAHGQQATYNAALAALAELALAEEDRDAAATIVGNMIDYRLRGDDTGGPYLWISAVGNGEFWPIHWRDPRDEASLRGSAARNFLWSPLIKPASPPAADGCEGAAGPTLNIGQAPRSPFAVTALAWAALMAVTLYLLLPKAWLPWGHSSTLRWVLSPVPVLDRRIALAAAWFGALLAPALYCLAVNATRFDPRRGELQTWLALVGGNAAHAATAATSHDVVGAALARALDFRSGLSPLVPTAWLAVCALLLTYGAARRQQLLQHARSMAAVVRDTPFEPLEDRLRQALGEAGSPWTADRIAPYLVAMIPAAIAVWAVQSNVRALNPQWADAARFVFVGLVYAVGVAGCRFFLVWQRLRALLRAVGRTPLLHAFERLPDHCAEALGFRSSRGPAQLGELRDSIDRLELLRTRSAETAFAGTAAAAPEIASTFDSEVNALAGHGAWAYGASAQKGLAEAAARLLRQLPNRWDEDLAAPDNAPSAAPTADGGKEKGYRDELGRHQTRPKPALPQLRVAEEFVAAELTRYFGYVFLHLRILLTGAMLGALSLCFAIMSYPFHPQQTLLRLTIGLVLALVVVFATVLLQSERNTLLSLAANRRPNHVDLDARFFQQAATFVGLPLLTLLATQFPALDELVQRLRGY
ncbi:hypothetical protein KF840_06895 [bacterium]|nr:hypothetical protein [bacterium]